jgi:hypothetical protein
MNNPPTTANLLGWQKQGGRGNNRRSAAAFFSLLAHLKLDQPRYSPVLQQGLNTLDLPRI